MDPVTIITTAASVVGTAIKISKSLYDTVEALKDAPSDVRALCATVESVKSAVSRLVVLMDDADKYAWPDCWLEDVSVDIDAISAVLSDVERLLADWEDSRGPGADKKSGSAVRDAWRNWKWHLNAEEIQRCTKKLRDARDDLGLQLSTIQISTTAQTSQDVIEVKDMLGSIEAKLVKNVAVYDQRAFNAELSAFGEQIESLRLAVLGLNGQAKQPTAEQELQRSQDVDKKDVYAFSSQRSSLDSTQSGSSSPILSPLAALNSHAFAQNQNITASYKSSKESPMSIAVLGLQLSAMKQKHDELLIHWNNAEDHIAYLKDEIDSLSGGPVSRTEQNTVSDEQSENPLESNIREDEIDSREAVIGVLQAQNEALQDMVSGRVTVVGYKDKSESDARKLSRKIIKKNETILQQQEEIDLLAWRLQGEQSALREQLKVNKILGAHVKRQQEADGHRRTRLLTPSPQPSERVSNEGSSDRHGFRPWTPASDATRPSSSSSIVSKVSFLKKPPSPWQGSSVPAVPAGQK
ncbi:hypothetical protein BJ166DRAFT_588482 [Pestalotiopsis sp. NC0098]|nr:hypothetical protein BJ166DRAFT_588482 [Pestalotiopsis sp. NC0098]